MSDREMERIAEPAPRKPLVYLAAPVSPTPEQLAEIDAVAPESRAKLIAAVIADNLARARRWLRWLVEHTDWSIVASWMPYVETLDEERWRERGLADDLACIERCDAIVLVGGRVSSGMAIERDHAHASGLEIVDMTKAGVEPPIGLGSDMWVSAIAARRIGARRRG